MLTWDVSQAYSKLQQYGKIGILEEKIEEKVGLGNATASWSGLDFQKPELCRGLGHILRIRLNTPPKVSFQKDPLRREAVHLAEGHQLWDILSFFWIHM